MRLVPSLLPALVTFLAPLLAAAQGASPPPAPAAGPVIELAPEHQDKPKAPAAPAKPTVALGAGKVPDEALVRGLTEKRLQSAAESTAHTSIGGYGEIYVTGLASGKDASRKWTGDVRR